jgi:Methyltransferase domain
MRDLEKPSSEAADAVVPLANAKPPADFSAEEIFGDYLESTKALGLTIPPGIFPLPTTWSNELVDVRFWHKADIEIAFTGVDPSDGFPAFARHKVADERATLQVGDAQTRPVADGSSDATVAGLVINFSTEPVSAIGPKPLLHRFDRCLSCQRCNRRATLKQPLGSAILR